ncbi:odorant receptor 10-like isoform X2 [Megalopta genalis]|uniref:odorant receptor 10-like isoform X2 n=1 Tax=Megalopta genalis TaxID=115081 RepID=UPI003FD6A6CE
MASPSAINKTMKFCLHFVGIWPGTPFPDVHKFFWIVTMILLQTYQYDYIISHYKTERLAIVIDSLTIAIPFSLVCFKLIAIWTNQSVLREILTTMKEDCEKYAVTDTDNLIAKTSVLSFRLTTAILAAHITCSTLYIIGVLGYQQGNSTTRELLFRMDLPFDTNVSPAYELVVTEQILHLLSSSLTFSTFGSLLLTMTLHVGCLVDILCNRLLESSLIDKEQIRFLIIRQQEITMFVKKLEQLFTYIALVQLLANTIVTCCTGYLISVGLENVVPVFLKCIMFYNVMCLDAFTYCFVGEFLEIKSNMIAETAYGIPWYDLDPNVSRQVVLLILRAHNGLPLTFGKFSKLSLESFTAMMKASASYMSVLLAMS